MNQNYRISLLCLALVLAGVFANAQGLNWAKSVFAVSSTSGSLARANTTAIDSDGNMYAAIWTGGDTDIEGITYPSSLYNSNVVKYDAAGNVLWVKRFGASGSSIQVYDMKVDQLGNVYVLGTLAGTLGIPVPASVTVDGVVLTVAANARDYVLMKWNASGVLQWISTGGGSGDRYPFALALDQADNIYMAGTYAGVAEFDGITLTSTASGTGFLAKFAASGNILWAMSASNTSGSNIISMRNVGVDASGNIFLEGITNASFNWGSHTVAATQTGTAFWLKMDSTGQALNSFTLQVPVLGWTNTMAVDAAGNSYLANSFSGTLDLGGITLTSGQGSSSFIAKYDPNGVLQWATQLQQSPGNQHFVRTHDLAFDGQGRLYLSGFFKGDMQIGTIALTAAAPAGQNTEEAFAAAFDKLTGSPIWAVKGTGQGVEGIGIDANAAGQVAWVGDFQNEPVTLGSMVAGTQVGPYMSAAYVSRILQDYNSITGSVFIDSNNNGVQDASETGQQTGTVVQVMPGNLTFNSQNNGSYSVSTGTGNFSVGVNNPPLYYNVLPTGPTTASFSTFGNFAPGRDFALQPIPNQQDLQINITALQPPRPGFPVSYRITYKNPGTVAIPSGSVSLAFDPLFTFLSSSQTATQTGNTLNWNFSNLQPLQTQNIDVLLSLTALAPLGDSVSCTATINPLAADLTPANNTETSTSIIVGSFDPNSIEVNHEQLTLQQVQSGQKLNYTIRFQNMGTDTAFTVMLRDSIPAYLLNLGTIELVSSSHSCTYSLNAQGILTVMFTNIRLPHQGINSIGSNGFVRFQIKPFQTLAIGDIIPNEAHIYFDYNAPITTNTAETEVVQLSATAHLLSPDALQLYPNPASDVVRAKALFSRFAEVKLRLLNVLGQEVYSRKIAPEEAGFEQTISLRGLPNGVYSVQLQTETGSVVKRLVKQ